MYSEFPDFAKPQNVRGIVIDATTKKPIANASVGLFYAYTPALFDVTRGLEKAVYADENGEFEFTQPRRKNHVYFLNAEHPDYMYYYQREEVRDPTLFYNKVTLTLTPKAWVRVKLNHVSDYDQGNGYTIGFVGGNSVQGGGESPYRYHYFII